MIKRILFFLIFPVVVFAQDNFDVRKTKWGMTLDDVKKSENTLVPFQEKFNELIYNDIELNESIKCKLIYTFSNGKLIEVLYLVYGPNDEYSRVTCENNVPISYKLEKIDFIFKAFLNKKMIPFDTGWSIQGSKLEKLDERLKRGNTDTSTFKLIQDELDRVKGTGASISFENARNWANFRIKHFVKEDFNGYFKCNDDYYNTYLWLKVTPSYEVEKELKRNDF